MAKVPDTNTFSLTDVESVLDDNPLTDDFLTVVSGTGGLARFSATVTTGMEVGQNITITGSTWYNTTANVSLVAANYFELTGVNYSDNDSGTWTMNIKSLDDCFDSAEAIKFDPRYEGYKNQQSNFRNYGSTGVLAAVDHEDDGGLYIGMTGDYYWFWVCSETFGIRCYDMTTGGVLTLMHTAGTPLNGLFHDCHTQMFEETYNNIVFVTNLIVTTGRSYIRTYTYSRITGVMTYSGSELEDGSSENERKNVFGDGNYLVFVVGIGQTQGIRSYTYDSGGILTYKAFYNLESTSYYDGVYAGGYLFVVGVNGITSFTRNTSTGVLTKVAPPTGAFIGTSIVYDSGLNLLFVGTVSDGAVVYSFDGSGVLTQEYIEGSGNIQFPAYHPDSNYVYYQSGGTTIRRYRVDENNDLVYIGEQTFNIYNRLMIWDGHFGYQQCPNILIASDGTDGIRTYLIDYD